MKIQLIRHTGEFETVKVDQTQEDGSTEKVEVKREILETVRETEVDEDTRGQISRAYQLRAQMLTRDTEDRHETRMV